MVSITPSVINTTETALRRFSPVERDCYTDEEFQLPNLLWEYGYRYSIKNCLYEAVIQKIIKNCSCFPSTASNVKNLEICTGKKLKCSRSFLSIMGSHKNPNLSSANNTVNRKLKCLQRCNLQTETIMTTSSIFPNKKNFMYQSEMCLVLQKITTICTHNRQKKVFESKVGRPTICQEIIELNKPPRPLCTENNEPDIGIASKNMHTIDFLFNYSVENIALVNIFIKDPYYTSFSKSEQIPVISFIGNAGGLVSLCLGISCISAFEVIYHLFNYLHTIFLSLVCRTKSSKTNIFHMKK